jgi:hypothetical protein
LCALRCGASAALLQEAGARLMGAQGLDATATENAQERDPQRKIAQSQVDDASYRRCAGRDERCADGDLEISVRQLANAEPCGPSDDPADRRRIARMIETEFGIEGEGNVQHIH